MTGQRDALSRDAFIARLREEGEKRYHDRHDFHVRMHAGKLSKRQIQAWVENRFYYQTRIPIKDAIILSKSEDPAFRRVWMHRISDHDGKQEGEGSAQQVTGNLFESCSGNQKSDGKAFTPPYEYKPFLLPAAQVKALVEKHAGATLASPTACAR